MKNLLAKIALFSVGTLLLSASLVFLLFYITYLRTQKTSFKIEQEAVIVGNSLPVMAIDDTQLDNCLNWGKLGHEDYSTYFKLRRLLSENSQLRYILYGIGPWFVSEAYLKNTEDLYGLDETVSLMKWRDLADAEFCYNAWLSVFFKMRVKAKIQLRNFVMVRPFGMAYFGKVEMREDTILQDDQSNRVKWTAEPDFKPSRYLLRIVDLCRQRHIRLVFFHTPIYKREQFVDVKSFETIRTTWFNEVEYWDFSDLPLSEDCYYDVIHLNKKGAMQFTPIFSERLTSLRQRETGGVVQ